jgi:hypothetical protein
MDLEKFVLNLSGALNQVSERAAVNGMPQQVVSMSSNMNIVLDLMRIFSFGFFRSNKIGEPYTRRASPSATTSAEYDHHLEHQPVRPHAGGWAVF